MPNGRPLFDRGGTTQDPRVAPAPSPRPPLFAGRTPEPAATARPPLFAGRVPEPAPRLAEQYPILAALAEPIENFAELVYNTLTDNDFDDSAGTLAPVGDVATQLAAQRDPRMALAPGLVRPPPYQPSPAAQQRLLKGAAFAASFLGAPALEGVSAFLPVANLTKGTLSPVAVNLFTRTPLFGRWGNVVASEALSGSLYGSVRPLEKDESRAEAIATDAAAFTAGGLALRGVVEGLTSRALRRAILRQPDVKRQIALGMTRAARDRVDESLANAGVSLAQLPRDVQQHVDETAIQTLDPATLHVDENMVQREANLDPAVEQVFEQEVARAEPYRPPPATAVAPEPAAGAAEQLGREPTPRVVPPAITGLTPPPETTAGLGAPPVVTPAFPIGAERIVSPAVRGASGKIYVAGPTSHPAIMGHHLRAGVPATEFAGPLTDDLHPGRGFRTTHRAFITREEAARLTGHPDLLYSEDLHARRLLPTLSPELAREDIQRAVAEIAALDPKDPMTPPLVQAAVIDAATNRAVAETEPLRTAPLLLRTRAEQIAAEIHALPKRSVPRPVANVLTESLRRDPSAVEEEVLLNLTGIGPRELNLDQTVRRTKPMREALDLLDASLRRTRDERPIEVSAEELTHAPDHEPPVETTAGQPGTLDGWNIAAHLDEKTLDHLSDELRKLAQNEKGYAVSRLLLATTGAGLEALSLPDNTPPWAKAGLRWAGGFLLASAFLHELAPRFEKHALAKSVIRLVNPERYLGAGQEAFRTYVEGFTKLGVIRRDHADMIRQLFPSAAAQRSLMYVLDEGPAAPEWHTLTAAQQRAATMLHQYNLGLGQLGKSAGILDQYRENYVRHLLPPETFAHWKLHGFRSLPGGGFQQPRRLETLRELEAWAAKEGKPGPIFDAAHVHSFHLTEFTRVLGAKKLVETLERKDLILPIPKPGTPLPDGWRPVAGVLQIRDKIAPEEIARGIETIANPRSQRDLLDALDRVKTFWMRGIMFFFWEHGLNVLRTLPTLAMNPTGYIDAWRAITRRDPSMVLSASYGVNYFDRPEYGIEAAGAFQKALGKIGLGSAGARIDERLEAMDRILWDHMVPALQHFAWTNEMRAWTERTGGKFLRGSPEYDAAARRAADFANTVAGKIPRALQDPQFAQNMRLLLFSPQWTMTRISLITHAAGELSEVAAGRMNLRDARYLQLKMRQLAWGIGITTAGSLAMSGHLPEYNPARSKFYMRTGQRNREGREIGVDLVGWWQGDLKAFGHPLDYIGDRLNPTLNVAYETVKGRDYLGHSMTGPERIGNLIQSLGPIPAALSTGVRLAEGPTPRPGEALQPLSRIAGAGGVATLERPVDVFFKKYAEKILTRHGIPPNADNIFELSRILRTNWVQHGSLTSAEVVHFLAYKRRIEETRAPGVHAFYNLWEHARRILAGW